MFFCSQFKFYFHFQLAGNLKNGLLINVSLFFQTSIIKWLKCHYFGGCLQELV